MIFNVKKGDITKFKDEVIILGLFEEGKFDSKLEYVNKSLNDLIKSIIKNKEFKAELNEVKLIYSLGKIPAKRILIVGLGKKNEFSLDKIRQVGGTVSKYIKNCGVKTFASIIPNSNFNYEEAAQAFTEGIVLGSYQYVKYKTNDLDKIKKLDKIIIIEDKKFDLINKGVKKGLIIAKNVNFVRDLVNGPGNEVTPSMLANIAKQIAFKNKKIKCIVFGKEQIKKLGMGALMGVSQGSNQEPKFIILEYKNGKDNFVLVGKGITFDSGGISLKPSLKLDEMKDDMAGGGAVIGIIKTIAELNLKLNVIGIIPCAENLPSGSALKPGDIIKSYSGKNIEILNTDAEGRLILADALSYSLKYKPKAIIDLATLTGACIVALGRYASGLIGNDEKLVQKLKDAGLRTFEKVWELPLWEEYKNEMKSDIADIKNIGGWDSDGGTIRGAAFLSEFVKDNKWAHLDIAGTSFLDKETPYNPKGATGVGVRLIVDLLERWKY